jgi:hypothetical protein
VTGTNLEEIPEPTSADAVDEIVTISKRRQSFPLRPTFVQLTAGEQSAGGPLSYLVRSGDHRALLLFLLLLTKASSDPWDATLPSAAWARALAIELPTSKSARTSVSKTWKRLENIGLVQRSRKGRLAQIHLLREDGSRSPYTSPGGDRERYVQVPLKLWTSGPDDAHRWYQELKLSELAALLVALTFKGEFSLPYEKSPEWYSISADTMSRGMLGLETRGLLQVVRSYRPTPLSQNGYTQDFRFMLQGEFASVARRSAASLGATES